MKTYTIEVRETLSRLVEIEAKDSEQAIEKARAQYENQEIILGEYDFDGNPEFFDQTDSAEYEKIA